MFTVYSVCALAFILWLVLLCAWAYLSVLPTHRSRTRATRRGGYVRPHVLRTSSRAAPFTSPLTRRIEACIRSRGGLGEAWAVEAILRKQQERNKQRVPTPSGYGMVEAGKNGAPLHYAALPDDDTEIVRREWDGERWVRLPSLYYRRGSAA